MSWLTATEALQVLGVRPQTLYANVSRKKIRAKPDPKDTRRSLYHEIDVRKLVRQHGGPVGGPPSLLGIGEVHDQDWSPTRDRVQAWPLAEGELQLVIYARGRTARSQCSAAGAVEDQRNRRCVNVEEDHTGLTQTIRSLDAALAVDGGEELLVDRHI